MNKYENVKVIRRNNQVSMNTTIYYANMILVDVAIYNSMIIEAADDDNS